MYHSNSLYDRFSTILLIAAMFYYAPSIFISHSNGLPAVPYVLKYSIDFFLPFFFLFLFFKSFRENLSPSRIMKIRSFLLFICITFLISIFHVFSCYEGYNYFVHALRNVSFYSFIGSLFMLVDFNESKLISFMRSLMVIFSILCFSVFLLQFSNVDVLGYRMQLYDFNRLYWPSTDPDSLGFFLLFFSFLIFYSGRTFFKAPFVRYMVLLFMIGLCFLTKSLALSLGIIIILFDVFFAILLNKKIKIKLWFLYGFAILAVSFIFLFHFHYLSDYLIRLMSRTTFTARVEEYLLVWKWLMSSNFQTLLIGGKGLFANTKYDDMSGFIRLDSSYFIVLINYGIIGLLSFFSGVISILICICKASHDNFLRKPCLTFYIWLVLAMFLTPYLYRNYLIIFFFYFFSALMSFDHENIRRHV